MSMEFLKPFDHLGAMSLLVPGIVILFVRSQLAIDRRPFRSTALWNYLPVSLVYYAIASPFVDLDRLLYDEGEGYDAPVWLALIFGGPLLLGLVLGTNVQKDLLFGLVRRLGLNPVHPIPTAWDRKFGNMGAHWVLVSLKDGTQFAGFCGKGSFMSSDPAERDIHVEQVYDLDDDDNWRYVGKKSVLVAHGEVRTMEFWPGASLEDANEQSWQAAATQVGSETTGRNRNEGRRRNEGP